MPTTMAVHDDHFIQNQSNRFKIKRHWKSLHFAALPLLEERSTQVAGMPKHRDDADGSGLFDPVCESLSPDQFHSGKSNRERHLCMA
jgi:hypothetical protein